eukprot:TRINITY_DN18029_c0_g1_i1.p1 TRINITY_DN18029_c0_g1~~TRINITY_DN18029_c0_g1_i1.p1  ORF type:complete len:488 (-),score=58.88 TRINITY_DN18029_c0_g1_i1:60-1523(-)
MSCVSEALAGLGCLAAGANGLLICSAAFLWRRDFKDHKNRDDPLSAFHKRVINTHTVAETFADMKHASKEVGRAGSMMLDCPFAKQKPASGKKSLRECRAMTYPLGEGATTELKLSATHLSFPAFLNIVYRHAVPLISRVMFGLGKQTIRKQLVDKGQLAITEPKLAEVIGSLCLETALAMNFWKIEDRGVIAEETINHAEFESDNGVNKGDRASPKQSHDAEGKVAVFAWHELPVVDNYGDLKILDLLTVTVDLGTKQFVRCKMNNEVVPLADVMPLLMFAWIVNHYKMHCVGNWASNVNHKNEDIRDMSIMNTLVNYLGDSLPFVFKLEYMLRVLRNPKYAESLTLLIGHLEEQGVRFHGQVRDLMPYSQLVKFLVEVRYPFLHLYNEHKSQLGGIDGEALFVSCVIHSLDHSQLARIVPDPLWFRSDRFTSMAEVVRTCVGPALHGKQIMLMRESNVPFFREFFKQASTINAEFADLLEVGMTA